MKTVCLLSCVLVLGLVNSKTVSQDGHRGKLIGQLHANEQSEVEIGGRTYLIDSLAITLSSNLARDRCHSLGMRLLTLETPDENDLIKTWLSDNGFFDVYFWTDAMRNSTSSPYMWTELDQEVTYWDWDIWHYQPDLVIYPAPVCINLSTVNGWSDDPCTEFRNVICEQY